MGKLLGILQRVVEAPRVDTRISLPYGGRNLCILVNKKKKTGIEEKVEYGRAEDAIFFQARRAL